MQIDSQCSLSVSLVICTCGRGARILETVESILGGGDAFAELIIVDQSRDNATAEALLPYSHASRVRVIRTETKGLGRARNIGLEEAASDIVLFTDDDCEVLPGWIAAQARVFAEHPDVALCYGAVVAPDHDATQGYIPAYTPVEDRQCRTLRERVTARGIGANFALRRTAAEILGGFDSLLGAGGAFLSAEDRDLTLRCLLSGFAVYECRDSVVIHHGFRDWQHGRDHTRNDWYGLGAAYAKPIRCGRWQAWPYAAYEFGCHALLPFLRATVLRRSQKGWLRLSAFVSGFAAGWRAPIDPQTLLFAPQSKSAN